MNAKSTYWIFIVVIQYFLMRLIAYPFIKSLAMGLLLGLFLMLALKWAGDGTWSGAMVWFKTHVADAVLISIGAVSVGIMAIFTLDQSVIQTMLDVESAAVFFWTFSCIRTRFFSKRIV